MRWVEELTRSNDAILDRKTLIRFQITGVGYGDKDFFVTDTFSDSLTFHAALLDELSRRWRQKITEEIGLCEELAKAVGSLARNLDIAASDPDHASKKNSAKAAQEQFYFRLDQPFRAGCATSTRRGMAKRQKSTSASGGPTPNGFLKHWAASWWTRAATRLLSDGW